MPRPLQATAAPPRAEPLLSAAEVGKILRVCKRTVQRYCSMGLLPEPIRINARVVRFRRSDIDSFLAARHTV